MRHYIHKVTDIRYRVHSDGMIEYSGMANSPIWRASICTAEEFIDNLKQGLLEPYMPYFRHKTSQILYRLNLEGEVELRQHSGEWMKSAFTYYDIKHQVEEINDPNTEDDMATLSLTERTCRQKAAARGFTLPAWLNKGPTPTMSLHQWETNFNTWFNQKVKENGNGSKYSPPATRGVGFQSFRQKVADPSGVQGSPHCC